MTPISEQEVEDLFTLAMTANNRLLDLTRLYLDLKTKRVFPQTSDKLWPAISEALIAVCGVIGELDRLQMGNEAYEAMVAEREALVRQMELHAAQFDVSDGGDAD